MEERVSSTQYRFSYQIRSAEDLPTDFHLAGQDIVFETGIFVPQDHCPDPYKGNSHPDRVFLLLGHSLTIYAHPTARQAAILIDFNDLQMVEHGGFLLFCWIRLFTSTSNHTFIFSSESNHVVDRLLKEIRRTWLSESISESPLLEEVQATTAAFTFKFQKRLDKELDIDETVRRTLFIPPKRIGQRNHLFHKVLHIPGDLLAITSRRVLWITDRECGGESRELYGSIARYAPIAKVSKVSWEAQNLYVYFNATPCWSIPMCRARSS